MILSAERVLLGPPKRAGETHAPRTAGVHLSGIIRGIAAEVGIIEIPEDYQLMETGGSNDGWWHSLDHVSRIRINIGLAWEAWYIPNHLPEVEDHPGEFELSDVFMTPDGLDYVQVMVRNRYGSHPRIVEVKATYKSINTVGRTVEEFRANSMWLMQIKGYCKAMRTRFASMHVLFLCGDYSWPQRPDIWRYDIEFTQEEIDYTWDMMVEWKQERLDKEAGK